MVTPSLPERHPAGHGGAGGPRATEMCQLWSETDTIIACGRNKGRLGHRSDASGLAGKFRYRAAGQRSGVGAKEALSKSKGDMMTVFQVTRSGLSVALVLIGIGAGAGAVRAGEAQFDAMRQALSKYEDPYVAIRDLYLSTEACVHYDGTTIEGHMDYPKGAMGIHFVNLTIQGPLDPLKPNVLLYEPVDGKLRLIGVEWLVPLAVAKERPVMFDQPFMGPMEGHEPLIPKEFAHYDLHAWLFKDNPLGMFSPTNPDVKCDSAEFPLLEMPTAMVQEP